MERAGAFLIIYSLTDSSSLVAAKEILLALPRAAPKLLLGNKVDLEHRRVVSY
jgi:GTPase SAR1 family protein